MGYQLVWQLLFAGYHVTIVNRGTHADPFDGRVERLRADRTTPDFGRVLAGRSFDAAVDFAAYTAADVRGVIETLGDRLSHYLFISTGSVYAVRAGIPLPSRESDFDGPLLPEPADPKQKGEWRYGVDKREAEEMLAAAWERERFPSTRIRIPVVNGERDPSRRLESYLWRIRDGEPVVLPDGGSRPSRQVYAGSVVRALAAMLGDERTFGQAYNLCQDEIVSVDRLLAMCADLMGAPLRLVAASDDRLQAAGLQRDALFPFTGPWNSILDPGKAKLELGFQHQPLAVYLGRIVATFLSYPPQEPPEYYTQRRPEVALARELQP